MYIIMYKYSAFKIYLKSFPNNIKDPIAPDQPHPRPRLCQLTKKFYNRTPQQIIESLRDSQTLYSQARP
jgi:hypothetical protein